MSVDDRHSIVQESHFIVSSPLLFSPISLVLVGGDGFYHEAVNSLERRLMEEDGLDKDIADIGLRALPLPIGIIPAGKSSKHNAIF